MFRSHKVLKFWTTTVNNLLASVHKPWEYMYMPSSKRMIKITVKITYWCYFLFYLHTHTHTYIYIYIYGGPGSSVGIATELRAGRSGIESRWGRDFPPVQTGPGGPPSLLQNGYRVFPGGKVRPGRAADHSSPFQCRGHGRVELYLYPPSGPHRTCKGITLPYIYIYIYIRLSHVTHLFTKRINLTCEREVVPVLLSTFLIYRSTALDYSMFICLSLNGPK